MKKEIFAFVLAIWVILIHTACTAADTSRANNHENDSESSVTPPVINNDYTVELIDGTYYMVFEDPSFPDALGQESTGLDFDSIHEVKRKIQEHDFEDRDCEKIKRVFPKDENGVKIFNLEKLYEPVTPSGMATSAVYWEGPSYSFYLEEQDGVFGYLHCYDLDDFSTVFAREYEGFFNRSTINVTGRTLVSDRNATVTSITTSQGKLKCIRYELHHSDTIYYIDEIYRISMNDPSIETSETVPSSITIYGSSEEKNFVIDLFGMSERPSVEWLLSFDMQLVS